MSYFIHETHILSSSSSSSSLNYAKINFDKLRVLASSRPIKWIIRVAARTRYIHNLVDEYIE